MKLAALLLVALAACGGRIEAEPRHELVCHTEIGEFSYENLPGTSTDEVGTTATWSLQFGENDAGRCTCSVDVVVEFYGGASGILPSRTEGTCEGEWE